MWRPGQPVFGQLVGLRHLNLSHNRVTELDSGLLADLTERLETLDLTANQVGRLAAGQFRQLSGLVSLRLDNNRLASLGQGVFQGLTTNLEQLSLANNSLGYLHDEVLLPLANGLRVLRLGSNQLSAVPLGLKHLTGLVELDLSNNQLREANNSDLLAAGSRLRILLLSGNVLEDLNGVLPSHPAITLLNISHNRLKWFDMAFFPRQLRQLDVQGNEVEELGNYYRMVEGFQLRQLDASNNRIASLGPHTFVVRYLDFSSKICPIFL